MEKDWDQVAVGDVIPGETRGCWMRVTGKTVNFRGRFEATGVDVQTGKTVTTWGMAGTKTVVAKP